jgi:type IV secretion system protein VirB1
MTGCDGAVTVALFACLTQQPRCLPLEHQRHLPELTAIVAQESGFAPFAIRDETTGESLFPRSLDEAVALSTARDAAGHVLGLGWFQITHRATWRRYGLTVETALDPCENMRAGAAHWVDSLRHAALQRYNSGRTDGAPGYAAQVVRRLARPAASPGPATQPVILPPPSPLLPDLGRGRPGRDLVTGR